MKIIQLDSRIDGQMDRIDREIALHSRCKASANIVRYKEHFTTTDNKMCIVMEYMEGGDLQ